MKKLLFFVAMLTLVSFKTADTTISAEERKFAIDELTRTKKPVEEHQGAEQRTTQF